MSRLAFKFNSILVIFLILCDIVVGFFDPLSLGLIAGGASLLYNQRYRLKEYTICQLNECCIDSHIPANMTALSIDLQENVFGQHIVLDQLMSALRTHYNDLNKSKKPLVLSFHGTPGTGKNYVADRIAKHLYARGTDSEFLIKFMGRTDFPMESEVNYYRLTLRTNVINAIKRCPRSLFIFDEVDKMPVGVLDALTSLLDHHDSINGINFRHATFIFLSNAGGPEITEKLVEHMEGGTLREDTNLFHFEKLTEISAYNVAGGLRKASLIESSLIDHFIPFLPLEKRHVEKCIIAEFKNLGIMTPTYDDIEEISSNYVTYYKNIFSTSGCKRLNKKVGIYSQKYFEHTKSTRQV